MSVLIKNMKMPKSCDMCWALDDYGDYPRCRITEEQRGYNFNIMEKRMDNCPLVDVPMPHGDLIDRNTLTISTAVSLDGKPYQYVHIDNIKVAPTIIPADDPKEEQA